jgi:hypothetical protein
MEIEEVWWLDAAPAMLECIMWNAATALSQEHVHERRAPLVPVHAEIPIHTGDVPDTQSLAQRRNNGIREIHGQIGVLLNEFTDTAEVAGLGLDEVQCARLDPGE